MPKARMKIKVITSWKTTGLCHCSFGSFSPLWDV